MSSLPTPVRKAPSRLSTPMKSYPTVSTNTVTDSGSDSWPTTQLDSGVERTPLGTSWPDSHLTSQLLMLHSETEYWLFGKVKDTTTSPLATPLMATSTLSRTLTTLPILKEFGVTCTTPTEETPRDQSPSSRSETTNTSESNTTFLILILLSQDSLLLDNTFNTQDSMDNSSKSSTELLMEPSLIHKNNGLPTSNNNNQLPKSMARISQSFLKLPTKSQLLPDKDKRNTSKSEEEIRPSLTSTLLLDGSDGLVITTPTGISFSDSPPTTSPITVTTRN